MIALIIMVMTTSFIGPYVVSKGLSSIGAALAHTALAGAILGYLLGVDPYLSALLFNILFALLISNISYKNSKDVETTIGLLFGLSTAIAVILISLIGEYSAVAWTFLIGDVLGVSFNEIITFFIFSVAILCIVILFYKEFKFIIFDTSTAEAIGLNVRLYHTLIIILIALTTTVCLRIVGSILTIVMLIAPAAAAKRIVHSFEKMILTSMIIALLSSMLGIMISVYTNVSTSGLIGLIASLFYFVTTSLFSKLRYCKKCKIRVSIIKQIQR